MTNKFALAAVLSTLAVPALADGYNPGQQMQAGLLGLDAAQFTVNELAQIAAEDTNQDRAARIELIEANKANGTNTLYVTGKYVGEQPNNG